MLDTNSLLDLLLPEVPGLVCLKIYTTDKHLLLIGACLYPTAVCPLCATISQNVHSYYTRRLSDLPWADCQVSLLLTVRRFYCNNPHCSRQTFTERLGTAILPYARRTTRQANQLQALGLAFGGEAAANYAKKVGISVSGDTILKLVRQTPLPDPTAHKVYAVGIDEFAFLKGAKYGTILVDLDQHQVIDLLPDVQMETVRQWLNQHNEIGVVSRDRASAFGEAARKGAPQAVQIADRFHLAKNLWDATQTLVKSCLNQSVPTMEAEATTVVATTSSPEIASISQPVRQSLSEARAAAVTPSKLNAKESQKHQLLEQKQAMAAQVQALSELGLSKMAIRRELQLGKRAVESYLKKDLGVGQLRKPRPTKLDPYKAYLQKRCLEDYFDNGRELWREIQRQGYEGGYGAVVEYLAQLRQAQGLAELTGKPLTKRVRPLVAAGAVSVTKMTWLMVLPPERLKVEDRVALREQLASQPQLARGYQLVQQFGQMMRSRNNRELEAWISAVASSQLAGLSSFGRGVKQDQVAVAAGLDWHYSQGQVEGQVNRLKLIKRQGYGRAGFDLLRTRVMAA